MKFDLLKAQRAFRDLVPPGNGLARQAQWALQFGEAVLIELVRLQRRPWISVEVALPEDPFEEVEVWRDVSWSTSGGHRKIERYYAQHHDGPKTWDGDEHWGAPVTHWRKLDPTDRPEVIDAKS